MSRESEPRNNLVEIDVEGKRVVLPEGVADTLNRLKVAESRYAGKAPEDKRMTPEEIQEARDLKLEVIEQMNQYDRDWQSLRGMD
jgi:hypothetical protein